MINEWIGKRVDGRRALVSQVARELGYEIGDAMAFCVALLQDVNAHTEAELVNLVLLPLIDERNDQYAANAKRALSECKLKGYLDHDQHPPHSA